MTPHTMLAALMPIAETVATAFSAFAAIVISTTI